MVLVTTVELGLMAAIFAFISPTAISTASNASATSRPLGLMAVRMLFSVWMKTFLAILERPTDGEYQVPPRTDNHVRQLKGTICAGVLNSHAVAGDV